MPDSSNSLSIKTWPQDDRPREKLRNKGRRVLSNAELLAIIIGSGNKGESAVELSKRILSSVGNNLNALGKLHLEDLMKFKGIGDAKAISIAATLEIGRRRRGEELPKSTQITSSQTVFVLLHPLIGELPHEEFWIIYLNNSNKIISKEQLSKGGITGTIVDSRIIMKNAVRHGATALILAHNHPSGTLRPSESDKSVTKKLKMAGETLDIKILDHLIITQQSYFSFADEGLL